MATVAEGPGGGNWSRFGVGVIFNSYTAVGGCTLSLYAPGDSARSGPGREKGTAYLGRCSWSRKDAG